jgi:hypothetical protein
MLEMLKNESNLFFHFLDSKKVSGEFTAVFKYPLEKNDDEKKVVSIKRNLLDRLNLKIFAI